MLHSHNDQQWALMINELLVICVYDLRATGIILYLGFQNPCYLLVPVLLEVLVKTGCSQSTAFKLHLPGNKYFINILMYYKYYFYILFYQNSIIMPTLELQDPRELKKKKIHENIQLFICINIFYLWHYHWYIIKTTSKQTLLPLQPAYITVMLWIQSIKLYTPEPPSSHYHH